MRTAFMMDEIAASEDQDGEYKNDWNAARQLANDLTDDENDKALDYDAPGLSEEERMELIAQAARAAVMKFDLEREQEEELAQKQKEERNSMKRELQYAKILETPVDAQDATDIDKVADEEDEIEDYGKLTVKQLKEILRSRGLKVSGRKAELIERLKSQ